ncbi:MAG: CRTAC1 family protein [Acidobacteria bacterium]|nr:MAG: CRTAC1 family protein [Acidobacteriota bacterium]
MNRRDLIKVLTGGAAAAGGGALFYRYNHQARERASTASPRSPAEGQFPVQLADVTEEAGIVFQHNSGAFGKKYLPETLGSGCAFLDYDNDGWLDVLLVNGMDWPEQKRQRSTMKLYRNNRNGTFSDVTRAAGLDLEMYGIGVAVGDYDNDGLADLYITCYGQSRLFHNNGNGTFSEVTKRARLAGYTGLSTSALWFDYDRDGHLDLLVANYVRWSPEADIYCSLDGRTKSYCTPEAYSGATCWLFRNRGDGTFEDVTGKAGLHDPTSKSLGLTMLDYDLDGWPDVFVANDTQPNKLYRNNRNGTFSETAVLAGVAFSEDGVARAGMGADAADYDNSGLPSLVVTNFSEQMVGLYRNEGHGFFVDEAPHSAVGKSSRLTLGFGCFFFDVDLDGRLDLLVANGHIDEAIARVESTISYAESPHLFHNEGGGKFRDVVALVGKSFNQPKVARGAAYGDFDNDGDLDVLITTNNGPACLYRNDCAGAHSIRFRTVGARSNRDGIGTNIHVWTPEGVRWLTVKSGSSYLSQSDRSVTFGLGESRGIERAVLEWPSGLKQELGKLDADRTYVVAEDKGIIADVPMRGRASGVEKNDLCLF